MADSNSIGDAKKMDVVKAGIDHMEAFNVSLRMLRSQILAAKLQGTEDGKAFIKSGHIIGAVTHIDRALYELYSLVRLVNTDGSVL